MGRLTGAVAALLAEAGWGLAATVKVVRDVDRRLSAAVAGRGAAEPGTGSGR